ncbi:flagellar basal body rod protein [Alkalicoccus halolimnae]|uniref:Flagellar basal body rod protein n=1 Tax=Alkalicoccus halolimnae TaxID=1667239 RepID=A0A5C7F8B8_9BACI|nr:flagellar basal body rod protein [Alkalicoccus halolimnae]TXF85820.1 flagellar basal body rod protein [Alkalicoccus halolimnae]
MKFLLFLGIIVAVILVLSNLGPMILFAVGAWLLYVSYKQFVKAESTAAKVIWAVIGVIVLSLTLANVTAIIGVLALYFLYVLYRSYKSENPKGAKLT